MLIVKFWNIIDWHKRNERRLLKIENLGSLMHDAIANGIIQKSWLRKKESVIFNSNIYFVCFHLSCKNSLMM